MGCDERVHVDGHDGRALAAPAGSAQHHGAPRNLRYHRGTNIAILWAFKPKMVADHDERERGHTGWVLVDEKILTISDQQHTMRCTTQQLCTSLTPAFWFTAHRPSHPPPYPLLETVASGIPAGHMPVHAERPHASARRVLHLSGLPCTNVHTYCPSDKTTTYSFE